MLNISPFYFFLSFAIGLMVVYIMAPQPEIVLKFPSPYNAGSIVYKDKADTCYKYRAVKVDCGNSAKPQPIFEDFRFKNKSTATQ
jgi:hypothetical protein